MLLELVVIPDALHAPDDQLLAQKVIPQGYGDEGRKYLCPGVEVLHELGRGDPAFESFALHGYPDFSLGWFSAKIPTEENSCARLFSSPGFERMVHPIFLYLSAKS